MHGGECTGYITAPTVLELCYNPCVRGINAQVIVVTGHYEILGACSIGPAWFSSITVQTACCTASWFFSHTVAPFPVNITPLRCHVHAMCVACTSSFHGGTLSVCGQAVATTAQRLCKEPLLARRVQSCTQWDCTSTDAFLFCWQSCCSHPVFCGVLCFPTDRDGLTGLSCHHPFLHIPFLTGCRKYILRRQRTTHIVTSMVVRHPKNTAGTCQDLRRLPLLAWACLQIGISQPWHVHWVHPLITPRAFPCTLQLQM
mgnify:CR=1 FL=1